MNQTNGTRIADESLTDSLKEKWNDYEIVEREVKRYPLRLRLSLVLILLGFLFLIAVAFIPPNENPQGFVIGVSIVLILLALGAWCFNVGYIVESVVYPYNPAKTQEWRKKKDKE